MKSIALICLIAFAISACSGRSSSATVATARPTLTLTPLSTPLVYPPTPFPVGSSDNPLRLVLVPTDSEAAQDNLLLLETALSEALGVTFTIETVETQADAVAALCGSVTGQVTIALVDALAYAIARDGDCGVPVLRLVRGEGRDTLVGNESVILSELSDTIEGGAGLDKPFCRVNEDTFYTQVVPTLLLRTLNLQEGALGDVLNRRTYDEALKTLKAGGCWGTVLPASVYDPLADSDDASVEGLLVVERSARLPFGVLMMPQQVPLTIQERIVAMLSAVETDTDEEATPEAEATSEPVPTFDLSLLRSFIGDFRFEVLEGDDLVAADGFFDLTRLNFATLGR